MISNWYKIFDGGNCHRHSIQLGMKFSKCKTILKVIFHIPESCVASLILVLIVLFDTSDIIHKLLTRNSDSLSIDMTDICTFRWDS